MVPPAWLWLGGRMGIDARISRLAAAHGGSFTRRQAHAAGLSDFQLRHRVRLGRLDQIGPHSYRVAGAPVGVERELHDLIVDIGPPAWAAGPTAAALLGFDGCVLARPFHVLVPRRRSLNRHGVQVHRTDTIDLIDQDNSAAIPVTSAARTLIDLARTCAADDLAKWLAGALRDGLLSEDLLHRRIVGLRAKGRFGVPTLHAVLAGREAIAGGHSWLEREYLRLLAAAGLPTPSCQQYLTRAGDQLVRVDFRFPATKVVVEVLGYRWHRSREQMNRDAARMNALVADGWAPYQFTYSQLVAEAGWVVNETRAALARHGRVA